MKFIYAGIIIALLGIFIYYFAFYAKHPDIYSEKIELKLTSNELFNKFEQDEAQANALFMDKVIEVTGSLAEIQKTQDDAVLLILRDKNEMFGVICTMKEKKLNKDNFKPGDLLKIKGICKGYLSDVIINDCIITK